MPKSSARMFLVGVGGIKGNFMTKSGGEITADANKVYDGGKLTPEVLAGPAEIGNITVTRAYDAKIDQAIINTMRKNVGIWETSISVTPTDRTLKAIGKATTYSQCLLVGLTEPEYDASSGDAVTYELEFAVGSVA
ncbi:tail tube protein [Brevibacterium phage Cantare]|uniref:Tail tube protein n=1 Tax=Brevibacterium phage Cantare TaxID=2338395 RepID=A0A3G3LYM1_9CAUD|nr:tail tube protein [Brevibacterium phage Cantare]AYQ99242.1 tail tube protein [Brevibacterium phage Cantare]